jgi:hypothetical protein
VNDWKRQRDAICQILAEDIGLIEYLEHEESLPFPVIHLTNLKTFAEQERSEPLEGIEIYVFKDSEGRAKYFGVEWQRFPETLTSECKVMPALPVVETTVRWELIA